jgi:phenylacetic acid degradation operon negative regulatory protein
MTSNGVQVRRLTARSVILSALLGAHPAQGPAGGIVRLAGALGLRESAVRAALTRMVAAGDLERGERAYRLSPRLLERQRRQDDALRPRVVPWTGDWRLAIVTVGAEDSTGRAALREALRAARFGELREGVWTRPDNLVSDLSAAAAARLAFFTGRPDEPESELADRLFRAGDWARQARRLRTGLDNAEGMRDRFEIAAAIVRHILDDPVLPDRLLPESWPGQELRDAYERFRVDLTALAGHLFAVAPEPCSG